MTLSIELLFDEQYYLSVNTDVAAAISQGVFSSALEHYRLFGESEGRDPSHLFDSEFYAQQNPDVVAAVQQGTFTSLIEHFIEFGASENRRPFFFFNPSFYATQYEDVAAAVQQGQFQSLFEHFVQSGEAEGRSAISLFDANFYLAQYQDVAAAVRQGQFKSAFEHFIKLGIEEEREFSQFIDLDYYRLNYSNQLTQFYSVSSVEQISFEQTLNHLIQVGLPQGLNPSQFVSLDYYRQTYARELREFYQASSINQISLEQTFAFLTNEGLERGFNTSEFIDFNFYRNTFSTQLTNFYQVESLSQVSFEQTYNYMVSVGLQQGFQTSRLIDFDFYRSQFAQEIASFYNVQSITSVSFEQILQYIVIISQTQQSNSAIAGFKWNDLNGNGVRDGQLIQGSPPDVVFVIDVSGSANARFRGTPVGDVNNDGKSNRILDAELAGFTALNQELIDLGFADNAQVGIVVFGTNAASVDMDPSTDGIQLITNPQTDTDGNGISDVEDALQSIEVGALRVGLLTDFEDGLQEAQDLLDSLGNLSGDSNIIFLSDGKHNQGPFRDEVADLKAAGVNLRAYGVGSSASLEDLRVLDRGAEIFTTTDGVLEAFSDLSSGSSGSGGGNTASLEPGLGGVTIYLDLNDNGILDSGEPSTVTNSQGQYRFTGLPAGRYIVREVVDGAVSQTFPDGGGYLVQLGLGETVDDLDFGNTLLEGGAISGTTWIDFNGNGVRDTGLIQGNPPDVVFVVDVSRSTLETLEGTQVGDFNGDGFANTVLDAQLAGFAALNQESIDRDFGQTANVSIVVFAKTGAQLDMNSIASGMQLVTNPNADEDGNGILDVEQILRSITAESFGVEAGTRFEAGLQAAQDALATIGTTPGNGNVVFMSDGEDDSFDYLDEVTGLRAADVALRAFGVGTSASLASLQQIDPQAQVFTNTDELLGVFSGSIASGNTGSTGSAIADTAFVGVTVYLDLNQNGVLDPNEPNAVTDERGEYELTNLLPGTYTVRQVLPEPFSPTFPEDGSYTVTLGAGESVDNRDFGNSILALV